jgi:hypothetical protein
VVSVGKKTETPQVQDDIDILLRTTKKKKKKSERRKRERGKEVQNFGKEQNEAVNMCVYGCVSSCASVRPRATPLLRNSRTRGGKKREKKPQTLGWGLGCFFFLFLFWFFSFPTKNPCLASPLPHTQPAPPTNHTTSLGRTCFALRWASLLRGGRAEWWCFGPGAVTCAERKKTSTLSFSLSVLVMSPRPNDLQRARQRGGASHAAWAVG